MVKLAATIMFGIIVHIQVCYSKPCIVGDKIMQMLEENNIYTENTLNSANEWWYQTKQKLYNGYADAYNKVMAWSSAAAGYQSSMASSFSSQHSLENAIENRDLLDVYWNSLLNGWKQAASYVKNSGATVIEDEINYKISLLNAAGEAGARFQNQVGAALARANEEGVNIGGKLAHDYDQLVRATYDLGLANAMEFVGNQANNLKATTGIPSSSSSSSASSLEDEQFLNQLYQAYVQGVKSNFNNSNQEPQQQTTASTHVITVEQH